MNTHVLHPTSAAFAYHAGQQQSRSQRVLTWLLIAAVHAAVLGGAMVMDPTRSAPAVPGRTMMVSFVAEQQPAQPEPPPPEPAPRERPKPKPVQELISAPQATPLPIVTPPPEEVVTEVTHTDPPPVAAAPGPPEQAVMPPDYAAAYLNNPGPKYPEASRRRREEGVVVLKVLVSAAGAPEQVLIDRSSGYTNLDEAAADIVKRRWRFVPATQGNRAVSAWVAIPISFTLKNR